MHSGKKDGTRPGGEKETGGHKKHNYGTSNVDGNEPMVERLQQATEHEVIGAPLRSRQVDAWPG